MRNILSILMSITMSLFIAATDLNAKSACFCNASGNNWFESIAMNAGCAAWLSRSSCAIRETNVSNSDYLYRKYGADIDTLEIGFVGHSDFASLNILSTWIEISFPDFMSRTGMNVIVDDTRCISGALSRSLDEDLRKMPFPPHQSFIFRGTQVMSVGKWDTLFGEHMNFPIEISPYWERPKYYPCKKIENKSCLPAIQSDSKGICEDDNNLKELICCMENGQEGGSGFWQEKKDCVTT